jgi:hypothetical protein
MGGTVSDLRQGEDFLRAALSELEAPSEEPITAAIWFPSIVPTPANDVQERVVLQVLAPFMLLEGIWLARVAQPATAHRLMEAKFFDIYCRMVGLSNQTQAPSLRYRAWLTICGLELPSLVDPGFFEDRRFPEFSLNLPLIHLCLMHRPRSFLPELLGYTLAHSAMDSNWWGTLRACRGEVWALERREFHREIQVLAMAALEASLPFADEATMRIRNGWNLYRQEFECLMRELNDWMRPIPTVSDVLSELVQMRRPYAIGYHRRVLLQGRSLDEWLRDSKQDPRPLLEALRASPYVNSQCPEASRLIRALEFGGPMFGVMNVEERELCLKWIEEPQKESDSASFFRQGMRTDRYGVEQSNRYSQSMRGNDEFQRGEGRTFSSLLPGKSMRSGRLSTSTFRRQLFTMLLGVESPADLPPAAIRTIEGVLLRSRWFSRLRPLDRRLRIYDPEIFHQFLDDLHRRETERYHPLKGTPRTDRNYCRWAILQLAPTILVDGCWLAGIATAAERLDRVRHTLLQIYADEIGSGDCEWNHPNVYRRLLDSLDIELPALVSREFAEDSRFLDASFDIPIYLLSMGWLSERYFPELLGLNLSIEMNGLGAGYMKMVDILSFHGIDPTIIRLHLSIDNLAVGHAARAAEAITVFLEEIRQQQGDAAMQAVWGRILVGYRSLNIAAIKLVLGLMIRV